MSNIIFRIEIAFKKQLLDSLMPNLWRGQQLNLMGRENKINKMQEAHSIIQTQGRRNIFYFGGVAKLKKSLS